MQKGSAPCRGLRCRGSTCTPLGRQRLPMPGRAVMRKVCRRGKGSPGRLPGAGNSGRRRRRRARGKQHRAASRALYGTRQSWLARGLLPSVGGMPAHAVDVDRCVAIGHFRGTMPRQAEANRSARVTCRSRAAGSGTASRLSLRALLTRGDTGYASVAVRRTVAVRLSLRARHQETVHG